jgi:RNA polymerase sigma factor (sigma-70 family)
VVTEEQRKVFEGNYENSRAIAWSMVRYIPPHLKMDAVAAALARLWGATGRYDLRSAWSTFAYPQIRGGIIDFLREDQRAHGWNRKQKRYLCDVKPMADGFERGREDRSFLTIENSELVSKVLRRASEYERTILLAYLETGTQKEAAELCGVAPSWVSEIFRRIRKRLAA